MRVHEPCPYCGQNPYRPEHLAEHVAKEKQIPFALALHQLSPLSNNEYIVDCDECSFLAGSDEEQDAYVAMRNHAHSQDHSVTVYTQEEYQRRLSR